jgi:hypothetical protein
MITYFIRLRFILKRFITVELVCTYSSTAQGTPLQQFHSSPEWRALSYHLRSTNVPSLHFALGEGAAVKADDSLLHISLAD